MFFLEANISANSSHLKIVQNSKVSLNLKNASFKDIFDKIEEQTSLVFIYNNIDVDEQQKTDVNVSSESIEVLLDRLLKNSDLTYTVDNNYLILKRKNSVDNRDINSSNKVTQAQKKLTGKIIDTSGEPLVAATISVKGATNNNTITDYDGNFSLNISSNTTLIVSYLGYLSKEVFIQDETDIVITMEEDTKTLDEVLVVGFAKQKKANLTGAVSGVKMDELLKDRPVTNTSTLLQGAIPGLQVTSGTGEPGGGYSFNIRGTTSIQEGSPLILVDNVPLTGPLNLINPDDIESVSVLKDGGAAAIYGARGAFGVVLITTKGSKLDQKTKVNYTGNIAFISAGELQEKSTPLQTVQAFKDFGYTGNTTWRGRDTDKWIELLNEYNSNPGLYPDGYADYGGLIYQLKQYDLMNDFLGDTGLQHIHNLSISGGSAKTSYRISLGYVDSDGVMVTNKDSYNKYSIRSFLNSKVSSWLTAQLDMNYYQSKKTMPNKSDWEIAVAAPSFIPTGSWDLNGEDILLGTPGNLVRMSSINKDEYVDTRITGRLIANPVKDLSFTAEYTYDRLNRETVDYAKKLTYLSIYDYDKTINPANSSYDNTKRVINNYVFNLFGSYDKEIDNNKLTVLGGYNVESYHEDYLKGTSYQMINDELPSIDQAVGEKYPSDYFSEYALMGFFGRINYSYKDRYLLELNGRYDGSSKFPTGHRWGFFPSVSAGWRVSEEPFMLTMKDIIPELKLRVSYATIGNQNISPYSFLPIMDIVYTWINDGKNTPTLGTPSLVRQNFTWETIETTNFGVDINMFNGRFDAIIDIYKRKTKDMLDDAAELPAIAGTTAPMQNVADLESKGWEIDVKWKDQIGKVRYNIGFNLYDYKAKITKLPSNSTFQIYKSDGSNAYYEGFVLGSIWGAVTDRFYTEADFDSNGNLLPGIPYPESITKPSPGDVLFKDLDGDGVITNARTLDDTRDQKIIGNNSLRYQFGINGGIGWKNFDFSFYIYGVGKRDLWLSNELVFPSYYEFGSLFKHLSDYWTPNNVNAKYPRGYATGTKDRVYNSNIRKQTKYLLDGSFLRVKNIALTYSIPSSLTKKWGIQNVKVNTSIENPLMFHHLPKGLDPTIESKGRGLGYPVMQVYSFGLSLDF